LWAERDTTFGLDMICYDRLQCIVCTFVKAAICGKQSKPVIGLQFSSAHGIVAIGDELLELGFELLEILDYI
jgi:hypothetical protein